MQDGSPGGRVLAIDGHEEPGMARRESLESSVTLAGGALHGRVPGAQAAPPMLGIQIGAV